MEIEIKGLAEELDNSQLAKLVLHSVVNLLNAMREELQSMQTMIVDKESLQPTRDKCQEALRLTEDPQMPSGHLDKLKELNKSIQFALERVLTGFGPDSTSKELLASVANLRNLIKILDERLMELIARGRNPERWELQNIADLDHKLRTAFAGIEKNAKGKYKIVYNLAAREETDYLLQIMIEGVNRDTLYMPPVLQDVLRDLMANARKYTPPGGIISAGLLDNGQELRLAVEDNGIGIPAAEIEKVVDFGFRGSNIGEQRTFGGGYGLTKAWMTALRYGGRMWIRSVEGRGTRVSMRIPRPRG